MRRNDALALAIKNSSQVQYDVCPFLATPLVEVAVEVLCPVVRSSRCIHQLSRNPHPISGFSDATLEHVSHAKLAPDLLHVNGSPFIRHLASMIGSDVVTEEGPVVFNDG